MSDNVVPVDEYKDPVKVNPDDIQAVKSIQDEVDALNKYRSEMGRLYQLMGNLRTEADRIERNIAEQRRALADKYNLEKYGNGQWALDFDTMEFVKTAPGTPVIP